MRVDRHDISESSVSSALAAVPDELDRDTRRAQYGGATGIEMLADMLLDYAVARTVEIDPRVETRETWLALTSAAELYRDHARALAVPTGGEVRGWVEYLGVGFGSMKEFDDPLTARAWVQAFQVALAVGAEDAWTSLFPLVKALPEGKDEPVFLRALRVHWAKGPAEDYPDAPEGAMLRAFSEGDAAAFNTALAAALEEHRARAGRRVRDLIAWGPLALIAFTAPDGPPIEIESGYLPPRMINREGPKGPDADGPVARPDFPAERAEKWLGSHDERPRDRVEHAFSPSVLVQYRFSAMSGVGNDALLTLRFHSVLDPRAEASRYAEALTTASGSYAAAFRLASVPRGTPIAVTLSGRTEELPASGPKGDASDWTFAHAIALAWTVRSSADTAILAAFDVDDLRCATEETAAYARAGQAVLRGDDPRVHLRNGLARSSGDRYWECLFHPRLRVLDRIVEDDADGLNAALAQMLALYADFYSAGDNIGDPDGQLNFDALGLACLAHDRGIPVRVESDYLPRAIVEGLSAG